MGIIRFGRPVAFVSLLEKIIEFRDLTVVFGFCVLRVSTGKVNNSRSASTIATGRDNVLVFSVFDKSCDAESVFDNLRCGDLGSQQRIQCFITTTQECQPLSLKELEGGLAEPRWPFWSCWCAFLPAWWDGWGLSKADEAVVEQRRTRLASRFTAPWKWCCVRQGEKG